MKIDVNISKNEVHDILVEHLRQRLSSDFSLAPDSYINVTIEEGLERAEHTANAPANRFGILCHPPAPDMVKHLEAGNLVVAVKVTRERFGYSLKEAKDYCEMYRYVAMGGPKPVCMEVY